MSNFRLSVVGVTVLSLFVALFARLAFLQVVESSSLSKAASSNQTRVIREEARRGRILDRDGVELATNRNVDVIAVDRDAIKKDQTLLGRIATFLRVDESSIRARAADPRRSQFRPAIVADHLDEATIIAFREHQSEFVGAQVQTIQERAYPQGTIAAHLVGYMGEANEKELTARKAQGYRAGDFIGKSGAEAAFEDMLRGKPGSEVVEVDAKGRVVRVLRRDPPTPGLDVRTTIRLGVQRAAEEALLQGLEAARSQVDRTEGVAPNTRLTAPAGSAVALDVNDGGVLALASFPTFDPGKFATGITPEEYAKLNDPSGSYPLNNRAIQGEYAPGSTFKLFTSIAALNAGVIAPNTPFVDTGTFTLGDRRYRNAQGKVFGTVNLARALTVSSDVYYYSLGNQLWNTRKKNGDALQEAARHFGLGAKTGIELAGEAAGRIPDPSSRKKMHEQNPQAFPEGNWFAGDNVNLAIGQGDTLATPLQLANAYAAFANGGNVNRPHVFLSATNGENAVVKRHDTHVTSRVEITPERRDAISEGLRGVVANPAGTAFAAFSGFRGEGFSLAGKTGTAQVTGKQDSALFVAYGPTTAPMVAVSVVLEQAGFGGTAAAPVARAMFEELANQPRSTLRLGSGGD